MLLVAGNTVQQRNSIITTTITNRKTTRTTNICCHISSWSALFVLSVLSIFASQHLPAAQAFDLGNELNLKPTNYAEWNENVTYVSSTSYNARGMQPLYEITHKIIWFFTGKDPLPEGELVINIAHATALQVTQLDELQIFSWEVSQCQCRKSKNNSTVCLQLEQIVRGRK